MADILLGAMAHGILWAVMTIGVYMTYRVLDIPDLTVEGSITLGASVSAVTIVGGGSPFLACVLAIIAGMAAGLLTGLLHTRLKIPALLSGILTMIALYSINIRVMDHKANVSLLRQPTVFTGLTGMGLPKNISVIIFGLVCVAIVAVVTYCFLGTEIGAGLRATGNNEKMARACGINTDNYKTIGLVFSNGLVALSGALISQYLGFADVQMGTGAIVIGLASLIIGEVLFGRQTVKRSLVVIIIGAVIYRVIIALVLEAGMPSTDLKLFTALTVAAALYLPNIRKRAKNGKPKEGDSNA